MTVYEHAMFGASLALMAGVRRRQGWGLVATAAAAAALPDWDGLSVLFGGTAYANVHRVWGHNLLVAGLGGAVTGIIGLLAARSVRVRKLLGPRPDVLSAPPASTLPADAMVPVPESSPRTLPPESLSTPVIWATVGALAGLSHLPADIVFNGGAGLAPWPVPLLWPFDRRGWVRPIVPWGDVSVTVLFVGEMFALYRWPGRDRGIAALTLAAASVYLVVRGILTGFSG